MEFIMDMVHHNPGEVPFETDFLNPQFLKSYGYNSQVFKHINTAVTFSEYDDTLFANNPEAFEWITKWGIRISDEIRRAKEKGLKVYYHIDLFVLPKVVYEKYQDEICDEDGKISLDRAKTLEIHRAMFDEIFQRFPIDGLIIRVGETYLHDTPYHIGNGAVKYNDEKCEQDAFVKLIEFLREEVCEKHDKYLFFRTWDCYTDRFHANPIYYRAVTDRIAPHPKLLFSIKHTAMDFWRRIKFNESLAQGKHRQIIEIQCQREYEGKGAYPMYIMHGVINSFCENKVPKGIQDIKNSPLVCGIFTWSRGGGWHGPYLKNEFWCKLNAYVIAKYAQNPSRGEKELFDEYATEVMGLSKKDAAIWRKLCLLANTAVLRGRYTESYDRILEESKAPSELWMRDDRLGGMRQLRNIMEFLYEKELLEDAVLEKKEACLLWEEVKRLYKEITVPELELSEVIETSIEYGVRLFQVVYRAWQVMAIGYTEERKAKEETSELETALAAYDDAWIHYNELSSYKYCASLYEDRHLFGPGLGETIEQYRNMIILLNTNCANCMKVLQ